MFLPQVLTAITASLLGGSLARRFGTKQVYAEGKSLEAVTKPLTAADG